ncbi:hypothetical protein GCM10009789_19740 [Kribbella sancticallisti]|uniref:Uncharacterized protein n=1 Tax=Kribbella sancticallisti TaxID=460087 RepID=A0ABN2CXE1_9ACTN
MSKRRVAGWVLAAGILVAGGITIVDWWQGRMPGKPYELDKACSGTAYDGAKPFAGGGPHPIAVFMESDAGHLEHNSLYQSDGSSWPPSDPRDSDEVQLVACATVTNEEPTSGSMCAYGIGSPSVPIAMVRATYQVRVYELRTHREVLSTLVEGLDTECPPAISGSFTPDRLLSEPTSDQWRKVLGDLVDKDR